MNIFRPKSQFYLIELEPTNVKISEAWIFLYFYFDSRIGVCNRSCSVLKLPRPSHNVTCREKNLWSLRL